MKNRRQYFDKDEYDLIGIEMPINVLLSQHEENSVRFIGFIDVVFKSKKQENSYLVIDLKLSTRKWDTNPEQSKKDQLLLYKKFISDRYNCPMDNVEVKYVIMKRKIYEPSADKKAENKFIATEKRIQEIKIAQSERTVNKSYQGFINFFNDVLENSTWKEGKTYPAFPSKSTCRFCAYKNTEHCSEGID